MIHDWRSNAPPPQTLTAEMVAEQFREWERLDAERVASPPPPIYVSRETFEEWVRLGLIDASGRAP